MVDRIPAAKQGRGFISPRLSPGVHAFVRIVGTLYLRLAQGVRRSSVSGMATLAQAYERFERDNGRLLLLFRHVDVADGPVVVHLMDIELPRWCSRNDRRPHRAPHAHFLYGKDVLNWAGALARWAFPRLGGIPVTNGRMDRESHRAVREVLAAGRYPLAFAPEGQVTYHQFRTFDLAHGSMTLAGWAFDELAASVGTPSAAMDARVELLPIALGYTYGKRSTRVIREAVAEIDRGLLPVRDASRRAAPGRLVDPLDLTETLLTALEASTRPRESRTAPDETPGRHARIQARIDGLCEELLARAEAIGALRSDGTRIERLFRLRSWVLRERYREDVELDALPRAARGLFDARATVAAGASRYEQIVDLLEYVRPDYIPTVVIDRRTGVPVGSTGESVVSARALDRLVEYLLNLADLVNRTTGGDINHRFRPAGRTVRIVVDEPIDASAVLAGGRTRRSATAELRDLVSKRFDALATGLDS